MCNFEAYFSCRNFCTMTKISMILKCVYLVIYFGENNLGNLAAFVRGILWNITGNYAASRMMNLEILNKHCVLYRFAHCNSALAQTLVLPRNVKVLQYMVLAVENAYKHNAFPMIWSAFWCKGLEMNNTLWILYGFR